MARGLKNFRFGKKRDCTICVGKTKMLVICALTVQLICVFVFAYVKAGFVMTRLNSEKCCSLNGLAKYFYFRLLLLNKIDFVCFVK